MASRPKARRLAEAPQALTARAVALAGPGDGIAELDPLEVVKRREATYRRMLAAADLLATALALLVTLSVLGDDQLRPVVVLALPLVVVVAKLRGLYDRDALLLKKTTLDEAPELFGLATLYTLLVTLAGDAIFVGGLGTAQTVALWAILLLFALALRAGARAIARALTPPERCLLIGDYEDAARLAGKLAESPSIRAELIGRLPFDPDGDSGEGMVLGRDLDDLPEIVATLDIHRVVIAPHGTESDALLEAIRSSKGLGVPVSVLPRMLEVIGSSVRFDHLDGLTVMGVPRFGLTRSSAAIKRAFDAAGALAALVVLAPLLAVIAVAVKRSSPGPVYFRQRRIGRDGQPFEILKFRTMVDDAETRKAALHALNEADGLFKIADDPRLTPTGRLLRRLSLDELPQLLNVLRGEMSLVGPRPLVPSEDVRIRGAHRRRLQLKPGMTGQWQVFGSARIPLREMVTIDYLYVANWSLWGDIKILCRTLPYVLARRGI